MINLRRRKRRQAEILKSMATKTGKMSMEMTLKAASERQDSFNRTCTAGNVTTSTDALTRVTTFEYDPFNRLKKVTDPANGVTLYTYDGNGNLLTVKDAKNQTTTFTYDNLNRLASTTDPLGKTEGYEYDGADNLTKRITPKNDQITFAYDAVNQLLSKTLPGNLITSYQYDLVPSACPAEELHRYATRFFDSTLGSTA